MLAELAATKSRAEAGDRSSRKKMRKLVARVASLKKKAIRGDASAKRTLLVLNESGVFQPTQTITMGGPPCGSNACEAERLSRSRSIAGGFGNPLRVPMSGEQISNQNYRIAVLKHARRVAGNQPPTTLHFFKAKSEVDGTMRNAGISLFLPGSRPGRVTY
jgi:hypothetical protein